MVSRKTGHIVFISSVAGKVPIPFRSSFAASKHALQAFCDTLRAEVAIHNINVLISSPEYVVNDMQISEVPPERITSAKEAPDEKGMIGFDYSNIKNTQENNTGKMDVKTVQ